MTSVVYGLLDPRTQELRYIGKARHAAARLNEHLRSAKQRAAGHRNAWIRGLLSAGLRPELEVLEECGSDRAGLDAERFWISYYRMVGAPLTNMTAGGDGVLGYRATPAERARNAEAHRKPHQPDCTHCAAMRGTAYALGVKWTPERRLKQMAALAIQFPVGAPLPEHLHRNLKLGWGNKSALGKRQSPESQAKRSTSLLRFYSEHVVVRSAEHNAKISAAKRGKVHAADCRHCVSVRRKEI